MTHLLNINFKRKLYQIDFGFPYRLFLKKSSSKLKLDLEIMLKSLHKILK